MVKKEQSLTKKIYTMAALLCMLLNYAAGDHSTAARGDASYARHNIATLTFAPPLPSPPPFLLPKTR